MPSRSRRIPAAARDTLFLDPVQLVDFTRFVGEEVRGGRYPYVRYDADQRWHQRLYRDRKVDVWLISWLPSQGTQLHDHGGSSGAFTVLDGELAEAVHQAGSRRLIEQSRRAGDSVGFGPHYVHDVRNLGDRPAVSVHAYSAPLTSMNFYDAETDGSLSRLLTLDTDDPEPVINLLGSRPRSA